MIIVHININCSVELLHNKLIKVNEWNSVLQLTWDDSVNDDIIHTHVKFGKLALQINHDGT